MDTRYIDEHLQKILDAGIVNRGNVSHILSVLERMKNGDTVTVAFIGGSITQGCLASSEEKQYTHRVCYELQMMFPKACILYLNAPVGGTDSQFGVARVDRDILSKKPDLLIVEFSVNDSNTEFYQETYEGLIRKILKSDNAPALLLLMNYMYDCFSSAEDMHLPVAKHYGIPAVSMKESFGVLVLKGILESKDITVDNLHPNDCGHEFVAKLVLNMLVGIYTGAVKSDSDFLGLPEPITANRFESSVRFQNYNCEPVLNGFVADKTTKLSNWYYFAQGWSASGTGDSICFNVRGSIICIQYRKSCHHPAPVAVAIIDGDDNRAVVLDANFSEDWGDCLYLQTVAKNLSNTEHSVKITLTQTHPDDTAPFYLVSIITA